MERGLRGQYAEGSAEMRHLERISETDTRAVVDSFIILFNE